jgi:hypothetical protein
MPPKKGLRKELPVGSSSLVTGDQALEATTQPHTSAKPRPVMAETKTLEEPPEVIGNFETFPENTNTLSSNQRFRSYSH